MTGCFLWFLLPRPLFDAGQRQAVLDHGYETPEWYYIRDLCALRRDEIGG